jgi:hypothetical protein
MSPQVVKALHGDDFGSMEVKLQKYEAPTPDAETEGLLDKNFGFVPQNTAERDAEKGSVASAQDGSVPEGTHSESSSRKSSGEDFLRLSLLGESSLPHRATATTWER